MPTFAWLTQSGRGLRLALVVTCLTASWATAACLGDVEPQTDGTGGSLGGSTAGGSGGAEPGSSGGASMGGEGGGVPPHDFVCEDPASGDCDLDGVFVLRWKARGQVALPMVESGTYDFVVSWGDGTYDHVTSWKDRFHYYVPDEGWGGAGPVTNYWVELRGTYVGWRVDKPEDSRHVLDDLEIWNWGGLVFGDTDQQFKGLEVDFLASDSPDLSQTTSLASAFEDAAVTGDLSQWDTSTVTDMSGIFAGADFQADVSSWDTAAVTSLRAAFSGTYTCEDDGCSVKSWDFQTDLSAWDTSSVTDMSRLFYRRKAPTIAGVSAWSTSSVTDMSEIFAGATVDADLSAWDTSSVTSLRGAFRAVEFESCTDSWPYGRECDTHPEGPMLGGSVAAWDTSSVTDMSELFLGASFVDGEAPDVSAWDTSGVTDMSGIFAGSAFAGDLSQWNTSNVTSLRGAFAAACSSEVPLAPAGGCPYPGCYYFECLGSVAIHPFAADVSAWDTSNVTDMSLLFAFREQPVTGVSAWDTSNVENMSWILGGTTWDADLSMWDTSNVTDLTGAFAGGFPCEGYEFNCDVSGFAGNVSGWDTSSVTSMQQLFFFHPGPFPDVSGWNTAAVVNLREAFNRSHFNQDISAWNTSSVTDMSYAFRFARDFNQDISAWDTSAVTDMTDMFNGASAFDQNLATWDVGALASAAGMLASTALSTANYDALLNGWRAQGTQSDVAFGAGTTQYSASATLARGVLIGRGWTITDGGLLP